MKEKAIRFGTSATLVGVLTEPLSDRAVPGRPGIILLNSGILHHVGACRLYVQIARRLARDGVTSLRFDHSGVGDSEARKDVLPFVESAPLEVQEAMDYLTKRRGFEQFVLIGLCSGADMGFAVARRDERVVGILQMDPYAYRTWQYYVRYYGPRLLRPAAWMSFLRRNLAVAPRPVREEGVDESMELEFQAPEYRRKFPPREQVEETLRVLCARNVAILNVMTGGLDAFYNYESQYWDSFPRVDFGDLLDIEFMPQADHIFANLDDQAHVTERAAAWVASRWKGEVPMEAGAV